MNSENVTLYRLLAELYPDTASSMRVMDQVGMASGRVLNEQGAGNRWYFIVSEAEKAGLIPKLIEVARAEYPNSPALRQIATASERQSVLAIWPTTPGLPALDQEAEAAALYAVGLDYTALSGADATRDAVTREWMRLRPDFVVIGAHGKDGEIYLSDGASRIGWWQRLVKRHAPQLLVMMACESATSAHFDIPDAFLRAGVAAVIAVSDSILDTDAVLFSRVFWESFTAPMPVADAVEVARSTLSDAGAQMVQLREGVSK